MSTQKFYSYRLSFQFSRKGVLDVDESEATSECQIAMKTSDSVPHALISRGAPLCNADAFQLCHGGYASPEEAWTVAQADAVALCLLAADLGLGVDIGGIDIGPYSPAKAAPGGLTFSETMFKNLEEEHNVKTIGQKRGITVIEHSSRKQGIVSAEVQGGLLIDHGLTPIGLLQLWSLMGQQQVQLSEKGSLALELYNNSFFESSPRTTFLTLIQMLECLSERLPRADAILGHVELLRTATKAARDTAKINQNTEEQAAFERIMSSLAELRKESITQSIQNLTEACLQGNVILDKTPADFIKACYTARGELTHTGKTSLINAEFLTLLTALRQVCLRVLRHTISYQSVEIPPTAVTGPRLLGSILFTERSNRTVAEVESRIREKTPAS